MAFEKVAILGPGLLGGSLALAIRDRKLAAQVMIWGRREEAVKEVLERGVATHASTNIQSVVDGADLVILCTPLGVMANLCGSFLPALSRKALVTDVASVKAPVDQMLAPLLESKARWIGSHPMAGSEKSGLGFATPDLFEKACCIVTPRTTTSRDITDEMLNFWISVGSHPVELSPIDHDLLVAQISHLPHLLAALLVQSVDTKALPLAGPGFRDTTRIAAGSAPMWTEILINNRVALLQGLEVLSSQIEIARQLLVREDEKGLQELLRRANDVRKSIG